MNLSPVLNSFILFTTELIESFFTSNFETGE